jgi:hypothetical protein
MRYCSADRREADGMWTRLMLSLSAAAVVALMSSCVTAAAGDYIVEIGGTEGTRFGGTCLLVTGDAYTRREAIGTVPHIFAFSGDLISCAIQRKAAAGELRIVIKDTAGRVVAESSGVQPFGVIMAAGR